MIRFKQLYEDNPGGKYVSQRLNNGDWDYWLIIEWIDMDDACGRDNEGHPRYHVDIGVVAPDAVDAEEKARALRSCGWEGMDQNPLALVECFHSYGHKAVVWQGSGNNLGKLMRAARKESQQVEFLFGFYMDRQQTQSALAVGTLSKATYGDR